MASIEASSSSGGSQQGSFSDGSTSTLDGQSSIGGDLTAPTAIEQLSSQSTTAERLAAGPTTAEQLGAMSPTQVDSPVEPEPAGFFESALDTVVDGAQALGRGVSSWHFEGREQANSDLPSYAEATAPGSEWQLLSEAQSVFHDNGVGSPELKFIHSDGREAVYDGDTHELITDPEFAGTYNYVNPAPVPENSLDIGGWASWAGNGLGHLALDVAPYMLGGNARGEH